MEIVSTTSTVSGDFMKVVLIHGLFSSGKKWEKQKAELEKQGHDVVVIEYSTGLPWEMNKEIDSKIPGDADLYIGHSYGGLYLAQNYSIPSNKIVTVNSPGAERGHNYQNVQDPLALINPVAAFYAENKSPGGHSKLPPVDQLISSRSNDNRTSLLTKANHATTYIAAQVDTGRAAFEKWLNDTGEKIEDTLGLSPYIEAAEKLFKSKSK